MSQIHSPIAPCKLVSPESIDLTSVWSRNTQIQKISLFLHYTKKSKFLLCITKNTSVFT